MAALTGYWAIEAEFPDLRQFQTFSVEWHRKRRELHLAKYPDVDVSTRNNLDFFVSWAEKRAAEKKQASS